MMGALSAPGPASATPLTPRERDCLRLLATGLLGAEVRAELGISSSTLNAHLAAARRKLDVQTTTQAVLRFSHHGSAPAPAGDGAAEPGHLVAGELSPAQTALIDRLDGCQCFTEAWRALRAYLPNVEVAGVSFGVIADPAGKLEDGSWHFRSSMPDEMMALYHASGGALTDPVAQHVGRQTQPFRVDANVALSQIKAALGSAPPFLECLLDQHYAQGLCVPGRDPATGAPHSLTFIYNYRSRREYEAAMSAHADELRQTVTLFWDRIQRAKYLADVPGLSRREREALEHVVRGFAVAEMAEHLHVSQRSAEKFLAGARAKLGARNNAQAVYRAMVYRTLN